MKTQTEIRTNIYLMKTDHLERELATLEKWNGSARNKEIIREYHNHLKALGKAQSYRIAKLSWQMRIICDILQKDLDSLVSTDMERILAYINFTSTYADATKSDYRRQIISFFKWFKTKDSRMKLKGLTTTEETTRDEAIALYEYIQAYVKRNDPKKEINYSNIITDEDAKKLIESTPLVMEKAVISLLHETGCRVGEFLGIRIQDIEYADSMAMIRVNGKTGERRIPIIQSYPYLLKYLEQHLDKDNPNSLLWISKNTRYYKKPLHYPGIKTILRKAFKKTGITKKCNPHWMRHSRATILAPNYSEQILCTIMGWDIGSKEVKTYVHVGARQVEEAFKIQNGLSKKENSLPKIQVCVCGTPNDTSSRYCFKCGKALNIATFIEDQNKVKTETDKTIQLLMEIMQNPEMLKRFEEFKKIRA